MLGVDRHLDRVRPVAAEMPVVTPERASIETVNAVSNADSFLAAIISKAELVAALGRQRQADQPAALLAA